MVLESGKLYHYNQVDFMDSDISCYFTPLENKGDGDYLVYVHDFGIKEQWTIKDREVQNAIDEV
jgi:hypothetical protein